MIERQVRYNFKTDTGDQVPTGARYRWTFFVVNEPREVKRIKERVYSQLGPIMNLNDLDSGLVKGSGGLHYDFFSFSTDKADIEDKTKIYSSKRFRKDRDLWERSLEGLETYFQSVLSGKK